MVNMVYGKGIVACFYLIHLTHHNMLVKSNIMDTEYFNLSQSSHLLYLPLYFPALISSIPEFCCHQHI